MPVKDPDVFKLIERIGDHYQRNINNQHIRKTFLTLPLSNSIWDLIDNLTTRSDYFKYQGYQYQELYDQIMAVASLIYQMRQQVVPLLRNLVSRAPTDEQVVLKLVAANFPTNLSILADMLNELYLKVTNLDRAEHRAGGPVYEKNPELSQLGRYLVG
jgi:hypothetical protein